MKQRTPTPAAPPGIEQRKTISIEEAGRVYFGLCRNSSYAAANRGDIPTIKIGRLRLVPVVAMERRLASVE
jgi:hypothetical protein